MPQSAVVRDYRALKIGRHRSKCTPFVLTVFILEGGGYIEISVRYAPSPFSNESTCSGNMAITVSAVLAMARGQSTIKGGVYIFYLGVTVKSVRAEGESVVVRDCRALEIRRQRANRLVLTVAG